MRRRLCRLDEIPEGASRGFRSGEPGDHGILVVRRLGALHAYRNDCPHLGAPLDWLPDRFLDAEGRFILCATHGARFRIEDGVCIAGPCAGDRLVPVALALEAGQVFLVEE